MGQVLCGKLGNIFSPFPAVAERWKLYCYLLLWNSPLFLSIRHKLQQKRKSNYTFKGRQNQGQICFLSLDAWHE